MDDARSMDEMRRYWDEIARGEPAAPGDLDPDLAATIRRLHALDDAPSPDPAYARRLRETILQASTLPLPTPFPAYPNGRRVRDADCGGPLPFRFPPRREVRPLWALLATAALIALTLAAGFAAISGRVRQATRLEEPPGLPNDRVPVLVVPATPAASPPAARVHDEVLAQQRIDAIPPDTGWAGVERIDADPGVRWVMGATQSDGPAAMVYVVEQGRATVRPDGPVTVTRAGSTTPTAAAANTDLILAAGDRVFLPAGVRSQWRNDGPHRVSVLNAGLSAFGTGPAARPGFTYHALIDGESIAPPALPAQLTLRRITLPPGTRLPNDPGGGLALVGVDAGTLTIVWAKRSAPTVETGRIQVHPGAWPDLNPNLNGGDAIATELRNDSSTPLTMFLLTVTPLNAQSATPAAAG